MAMLGPVNDMHGELNNSLSTLSKLRCWSKAALPITFSSARAGPPSSSSESDTWKYSSFYPHAKDSSTKPGTPVEHEPEPENVADSDES
jgi:hypothetical protein